MYIVTGGAGFIGSRIVRALNERGISDIIVVDNLKKSEKFKNLVGLDIEDFFDKSEFRKLLENGSFRSKISHISHQGACSDTTEYDGRYMMDNNYTYSKLLLRYAIDNNIPFVYASSAAVYGLNKESLEVSSNENPLNVYGYSKLLFDQHVRKILSKVKSTLVGLRYFNVFGPNEGHKGKMASMAFQIFKQLIETDVVKLFKGIDGYQDGEQSRDFIYVDDVVKTNLFFLSGDKKQGIYNVGTGQSRSFNDLANILIKLHKKGKINYLEFPDSLIGKYQNFTQAEIGNLTNAGVDTRFHSLEKALESYYQWLSQR